MSGQPHQRQESPFLTRLPGEIRVMIYHCTVPGPAIHLCVDGSNRVTTKICGSARYSAAKAESCSPNWPCEGETLRHQITALPSTCHQIRAEILPIFQAKIFVMSALQLQRIYRSMTVFTSDSSSVSPFNPFQRLHVNFSYAKGGSTITAPLKANSLRTVVENTIGAKDICITFQRQDRLFHDLFPLTKVAIITLGKLKGLRNFRLVFKGPQLFNSQSEWFPIERAFQNKVAAVEQIFREIACAGTGDVPGLDHDLKELTKSDRKFLSEFRVKLEQILWEKHRTKLSGETA